MHDIHSAFRRQMVQRTGRSAHEGGEEGGGGRAREREVKQRSQHITMHKPKRQRTPHPSSLEVKNGENEIPSVVPSQSRFSQICGGYRDHSLAGSPFFFSPVPFPSGSYASSSHASLHMQVLWYHRQVLSNLISTLVRSLCLHTSESRFLQRDAQRVLSNEHCKF